MVNYSEIDSYEYTHKAIQTYKGLLKLISDRYYAGYTLNMRLNEYYVHGLIRLDSCGNALSVVKGEGFRNLLPDIIKASDLADYRESLKKEDSDKLLNSSWTMANLPDTSSKCALCGKGWGIDDFEDSVCATDSIVVDCSSFEGMSLTQVQEFLNKGPYNLKIHLYNDSVAIRNDNNIDLSPRYPDSENDWEKRIVKNKMGWVGGSDGITEDYVIQKGDAINLDTWKHYHKECYTHTMENKYKNSFTNCFKSAGFDLVFFKDAENTYDNDENNPWFEVATPLFTCLVGWRYRVINLKVLNNPIFDFYSLFSEEDVTKGSDYIHCYGYDKLTEYLKVLSKVGRESIDYCESK